MWITSCKDHVGQVVSNRISQGKDLFTFETPSIRDTIKKRRVKSRCFEENISTTVIRVFVFYSSNPLITT